MFTGIIEELGTLRRIEHRPDAARLLIVAREILADARLGDSIAVNGVCLTVTSLAAGRGEFMADVMAETLARTNLGELKAGDRVNLERAMRLGDRLGGHLVSGHIDGVGRILSREPQGIAVVFTFQAPPEVMRYVIRKGSVAIDGISLTVVDHGADSFRVSVIPHTARMTTLGFKGPGATVNLEADMLAKYVERMLSRGVERQEGDGMITPEFLARHGFA
ncbi:MAG: riboflavin synthase [Thermoanaerobacterales bacterium]|nr:riboflavin synthase [Bacillota bacterium]MDI6907809.1 riboflavin synthase [Thermoanaerobacterales bacterium]